MDLQELKKQLASINEAILKVVHKNTGYPRIRWLGVAIWPRYIKNGED